jgi:hypothetical protein
MANPSEKLALFTSRLSRDQFDALSRCAEGISLRSESSEIADPLVSASP